MDNSALRASARETLKGNWINAIIAFALISGGAAVIGGALAAIPLVGWIASIAVTGVFTIGGIYYAIELIETGQTSLDLIIKGVNNVVNITLTSLLVSVLTFLWSLLLLIPGIIKGISYSQALYILAEEPELGPKEAVTKSREMMDGHKMDYFLLSLSFVGWSILCIFTFGLGFLVLIPYYMITLSNFYLKVKSTY